MHAYKESRGAIGGPMRKGCGCEDSGLQPRNKFPELPASGVKNPAPVATGTLGLGCDSSGGVRLMGAGRGGNNTSISGTAPSVIWIRDE